MYEWFNISFDKFGRTSSPEQTEVCQAIFKKLLENDWLTENTMQQVATAIISYFLGLVSDSLHIRLSSCIGIELCFEEVFLYFILT